MTSSRPGNVQQNELLPLPDYENQLREEGFQRIMGLDEVGRGCLAGPVVAAGVILDKDCPVTGITDSKKIKKEARAGLASQIREHAVAWAVAWCDNKEIDGINILKASLKAMVKCVEQITPGPDYLLIDGNKGIDSLLIPSQTVVKGDDLCASIGAASILAKVFRDMKMAGLHREYPEFGWDQNVGYPTAHHYRALEKYGYTPYHRRSFNLRTQRSYQK